MRRFFAVLAVAASAFAAVPAVQADVLELLSFEAAMDEIAAFDPAISELRPTTPPEPGFEFTVGSVKVTQPSGTFQHARWAAHDGPNGPTGAVRFTADSPFFGGAVDVFGKVTCVEVNGKEAEVAAQLKRPAPGGATHIELFIEDHGNPVNGISPDVVFVRFTSSPGTEPDCAALGGITLLGESRGNAIVRDDT